MIKYIFFLGRKPLLSLAELAAVLPKDTEYLALQKEYLSIALDAELAEPQKLLNRLGGTTKIVKVGMECRSGQLAQMVSDLAAQKFQGRQDKVRYGVSLHSMTGSSEQQLKNCLMLTKKKLKAAEISSRFVNNGFQNVPTALVIGENLLQKGADFCAVEINHEWQIGETVALQDINFYSERDYERPERDPRLGMLPPKLAQIMINLAQVEPGSIKGTEKAAIYDPFCGIGTILMEGILMGIDVVGSDLGPENIDKCHKNLDWINKKIAALNSAGKPTPQGKMRLFNKDATRILKSDLPVNLAGVVSETFLGPPVSRTPTPSQIDETQAMIEDLLAGFLTNLKPLLPPECPVILSLLAYRDGNDYLTLDRIHQYLGKFGFQIDPLLPEPLVTALGLDVNSTETIIYERPDQIVCREIIRLKPLA